jgi:hypothetical protein
MYLIGAEAAFADMGHFNKRSIQVRNIFPNACNLSMILAPFSRFNSFLAMMPSIHLSVGIRKAPSTMVECHRSIQCNLDFS